MSKHCVVVVKRPLMYRSEHQPVGARLDVLPIEAADLLASGRAVLAHADDTSAIAEAVADHVRKVAPVRGRRV